MSGNTKVSAIIMALNAEKTIEAQIRALLAQTRCPDEIIIVDSESDDATLNIANKYTQVRTISVARNEFDHGGTRDFAFRSSIGDFVFFFTQDAGIEQQDYIEIMLGAFSDIDVAMVFARQVPYENAPIYEKLTREINYPEEKQIRTRHNIEKLGIKAFFMSNVCSAYRRTTYFELGGFESHCHTNEDMLMAYRALMADYKTVYEPAAWVIHSHNLSLRQEIERYKRIGTFMADHSEEFSNVSAEGEGAKVARRVLIGLISQGHILATFYYLVLCAVREIGFKVGNSKHL